MAVDYFAEIREALNFMENNLTTAISLSAIADEVGFSMYHFHRVFQSMLGESACEYLRKRRLTKAAEELLESKDRIFDIATRYQFGTQEAFTRAFKAMFGITPGQYRKRNQPLFVGKLSLISENIQQPMYTVMEKSKETKLIGFKCCCSFSQSKLYNLWNYFMVRIGEINCKFQEPQFPGLYEYLLSVGFSYATEFCCVAGILTDLPPDAPEEIACKTFPSATKYFSFGNSNKDFYHYIMSAWLSNYNCEPAPTATLEIFGENSTNNFPNMVFIFLSHDKFCPDNKFCSSRNESSFKQSFPKV